MPLCHHFALLVVVLDVSVVVLGLFFSFSYLFLCGNGLYQRDHSCLTDSPTPGPVGLAHSVTHSCSQVRELQDLYIKKKVAMV